MIVAVVTTVSLVVICAGGVVMPVSVALSNLIFMMGKFQINSSAVNIKVLAKNRAVIWSQELLVARGACICAQCGSRRTMTLLSIQYATQVYLHPKENPKKVHQLVET